VVSNRAIEPSARRLVKPSPQSARWYRARKIDVLERAAPVAPEEGPPGARCAGEEPVLMVYVAEFWDGSFAVVEVGDGAALRAIG
jgi:hypothetical protein